MVYCLLKENRRVCLCRFQLDGGDGVGDDGGDNGSDSDIDSDDDAGSDDVNKKYHC